MARSNTGSTSNYFQTATAPVTAVPCTLACWANLANITGGFALLNVGSATTDHYFSISAEGGVGGDPIRAEIGSANSRNAETAGGFSANTWTHCGGVFSAISTTGITAYINGTGTTPTTAVGITAPVGINQTSVGAYEAGGGTFGPLNGLIAECAVWNVALTAADMLALATGVSPLLVRSASLVSYWPLWGGHTTEIDLRGVVPLTMVGTMAAAAHCRIFQPQGRILARDLGAPAAPGPVLNDLPHLPQHQALMAM